MVILASVLEDRNSKALRVTLEAFIKTYYFTKHIKIKQASLLYFKEEKLFFVTGCEMSL